MSEIQIYSTAVVNVWGHRALYC